LDAGVVVGFIVFNRFFDSDLFGNITKSSNAFDDGCVPPMVLAPVLDCGCSCADVGLSVFGGGAACCIGPKSMLQLVVAIDDDDVADIGRGAIVGPDCSNKLVRSIAPDEAATGAGGRGSAPAVGVIGVSVAALGAPAGFELCCSLAAASFRFSSNVSTCFVCPAPALFSADGTLDEDVIDKAAISGEI
jgi:hypothetical protein